MSTTKEIKHLTGDQAAVIDRLRQHMTRLGLTDRSFHQKHLAQFFSFTVWHRIVGDKYTGDVAGVIAKCERAANELDAMARATASTISGGVQLLELPHLLACEGAVVESARQLGKKRITALLGETGAGKTETARHLFNTVGQDRKLFPGGVVMLEATPSWATYKSCLHDLGKALGLPGPWRDTQNVENDIVGEIRRRGTMLIAIDECQYFSARSVDLLKVLTNQTSAVLFVASDPVLWEEFTKKSWSASSQIVNRCRAVVRVNALAASDVVPFIAPWVSGATAREMATKIAKAATMFGRFDRVKDVLFWMDEKHRNDWTVENVENAIHLTELNLGLVK